ncbi:MAG: choice-of-anchor D domain-containing protein [Deltaproteobacteria bacterium]|nr:MAG: choice-of-anchor D domain-containing protein [Deltaproteobacteria bacterium]
MSRRLNLAAAMGLLGALAMAGCGGNYTVSSFPRMQVEVAGADEPISESGETAFNQAIQIKSLKKVSIYNVGEKDLTISGIDWATDAAGLQIKNKYVDIEWGGVIGADSFPYVVSWGNAGFAGLEFNVAFTPPLGFALDDFSDSVLVIKSDSRSEDGHEAIKEVRITFKMQTDNPVPRVTPLSYKFTNATIARPERQDIHVYNDSDQGTAPFNVTAIYLETASDEFKLLNLPSMPAQVLEPQNGGYQDLVFTVEYAPKDQILDTNAVIIETDATGFGTLRVALSSGFSSGGYSLSYSSPNEFDFTNATQKETRSVVVYSEGPAPLTIKTPRIEPIEARDDFTLTAWIPATSASDQDQQVTSWPRALAAGKSMRFDIEFSPANDGSDTANGQLVIPYESPDPDTLYIDLFSGDPKSKISLAPSSGNVSVTGSSTAGTTGTRKVVIYNDGNGPLQLKDIEVKGNFDLPAEVYSLKNAFSETSVAPGGLYIVDLTYDLDGVPDVDTTVSEIFTVTYYNDFTLGNEEKTLGLIAADAHSLANPTADPGTAASYAGAVVGDPLTLDGTASTPGGGVFVSGSHIWYLTAKPAGSLAKLNTQGTMTPTFVPDVAGDYTVELVVFSQSSDVYLYSAPATVTITVAP